jgi:hypothetical protein
MINPGIYFGLLSIEEMFEIKKKQQEIKPLGGLEVTGLGIRGAHILSSEQ